MINSSGALQLPLPFFNKSRRFRSFRFLEVSVKDEIKKKHEHWNILSGWGTGWWLHLYIWLKIPRARNNAQEYPQPQTVFSKLLKYFWNTFTQRLSASAKCISRNYTDSPIILCNVPCSENSCEQQPNSKKFTS